MGVSKAQLEGVIVICKCGCNQEFRAFPVYKNGKGGGLKVPEYKRGHHPNCRKNQKIINSVPWNKGLNSKEFESIGRQGKSGINHWNYIPEQNPNWFSKDFDYIFYSKKYGSKPRNKGNNKIYAKFRMAIIQRDNFTCQDCGMIADEFEDDLLQVHHVVFVKHDRTRIFDPSNVVTLCYPCHRKRHRRK